MSDDDDFEVIWEDPPPTGKYGDRLDRFVTMLKANPNQWGQLPPVNGSEGYPLSVGTALKKTYGDRLDYTSRRTPTANRHRIWARWLEEEDPEQVARGQRRPTRSVD